MLLLTLFAFASAWWLGLYLIGRNTQKALLRRAGAGLLAYALALAAYWLGFTAAARFLLVLPGMFWTGALLLLLADEHPQRALLDRLWRFGLLPLGCVLALTAAIAAQWQASIVGLSGLIVIPLLGTLMLVLQAHRARPKHTRALLLVGSLFFTLSVAALLLPWHIVPTMWLLIGIGIDLELLGVSIALSDAFDEGETLQRDIVRSLVAASAMAVLFGGISSLVLLLGGNSQLVQITIFVSVAAAIAVTVFANALASLLDRIVFRQVPQLQQERALLREAASALPRLPTEHELLALDAAEFARVTRRALSNYGDLARLASSPLIHLPVLDERLLARNAANNPIERATELKALLAENIARLKPRSEHAFGTSDEWRYYNALYFPYVAGLRPYSQRNTHQQLDPTARAALDWFRSQVPERTLHNWQNAAARLVAEEIRRELATNGAS